jgi:hypothetical protein
VPFGHIMIEGVRPHRAQSPWWKQESFMDAHTHAEPTVVVIFGGDDLTHRKYWLSPDAVMDTNRSSCRMLSPRPQEE